MVFHDTPCAPPDLKGLRVRLHVTETKSHPGMKKFLFTREFHPGMKFNLKENLSLSMKTYNKIYHFGVIC